MPPRCPQVVDMSNFYSQYKSIKPYLQKKDKSAGGRAARHLHRPDRLSLQGAAPARLSCMMQLAAAVSVCLAFSFCSRLSCTLGARVQCEHLHSAPCTLADRRIDHAFAADPTRAVLHPVGFNA